MPSTTLEKVARAVVFNGLHRPVSPTLISFVARTQSYYSERYTADRPQG